MKQLRSRCAGFFGFTASALALATSSPALATEESAADTVNIAVDHAIAPVKNRAEMRDAAIASLANLSAEPAFQGPIEQQGQAAEPAPEPAPASPPTPPQRPAPKPIDLRVVASQFLDVPVSGDADSTARYAGRIDGYFNIRSSAFGGSNQLTFKLRPEFTWGETSNGEIGLIPGNTALFRPEGAGDFDLSASVHYQWASGTSLEVGKINVLDISGQLPIVASDGHFGFQNLGLALPPTAVVPNTLTGAALQIPTGNKIIRLWVFDPDSQYERTGFETAFESGVGFLASLAFRTRFGGMPGIYNFAVVGSTRDQFAVDILPVALTPPPQPIGTFGDESGELALQLSAYQFVKLYPEAPGKGWGILARFQASSGDPTFLDYSGYFGVSGNPRFRPQDRFGLAYFQYSLTNELVDDIAFRLGIEDEQGVEAFYTYQFADGFGFTANVQVVDSAVAFRSTGVTVGARLTSEF